MNQLIENHSKNINQPIGLMYLPHSCVEQL
jgi:hypothetical protein